MAAATVAQTPAVVTPMAATVALAAAILMARRLQALASLAASLELLIHPREAMVDIVAVAGFIEIHRPNATAAEAT